MEQNSHHRDLIKSVEELIFGAHATRKNRFDIERFVAALLKAIREEVARQTTPEKSGK